MKKLPDESKSERNLLAFRLMDLVAQAESNKDFSVKAARLGYKFLPEYSHGDLSLPRFCCTTVQKSDSPE